MLTVLAAIRALRMELLALCASSEQRALVERSLTAATDHVLAAMHASRRAP